MAELVGVIASSITLVGVVAHLANSIVKLKDCWDQFRDAPDDIKWIVREIEIFGHVLADIEADMTNESTAPVLLNSKSARKNLELCMEASEELDIIVQELGKDLESSSRMRRSYAAAKVVVKNTKMEKHRLRLQNVTRLLSLCQQWYTRVLVQAQPELIAKKVALSISDSSHVSKSTSRTGPHLSNREVDDQLSVDNSTSTSTIGSYRGAVQMKNPKGFTWRLKLHPWIGVKALELAGLKAPDGWKIALRTYNTVSLDAQVVRYATDSNIQGLQELFASGKASPFDRIEGNGYNLLHYANGPKRDEVFEFLLNLGADPTIGGDFDRPVTPLQLLVWQASQGPRMALLPFFRRLLPRLESILYETPQEIIDGILPDFHGTAEEFLFFQRECCPSYYQMPRSTRIAVATRAAAGVWSAHHLPELIRMMLGKDPLNVDDVQEIHESDLGSATLVHSIAHKIGTSLAELHIFKPRGWVNAGTALYKSWNAIFCELVTLGIDVHLIADFHSPLSSFLQGYLNYCDIHKCSPDGCNSALKVWLTDLQTHGLDLEDFGRIEKQLMDDRDIKKDYECHFNNEYATSRRLISLCYGQSPDAWHLWWSGLFDYYFEDFWDLVESQMDVMAGAWPEDAPYRMS